MGSLGSFGSWGLGCLVAIVLGCAADEDEPRTQVAAADAKSAEECTFLGAGGDDGYSCDFVTVEFSQPIRLSGVEVEVVTSKADRLTLDSPEPGYKPAWLELLAAESEHQALGFVVRGGGGTGHYSPVWLSAVVRLDDQIVGSDTLEPTYSCVTYTVDNWCWEGTDVMQITPP